jgi:hypothetical protein
MADKHAEVIFETGSKSVVHYDDEQELRDFVNEHTNRAVSGERGGPTGHAAERISKVLLYDEHPGNYASHGLLYSAAVESLVKGLTDDDKKTINVWDLIAALRREVNATNIGEVGPHDSLFKMQHTGELALTDAGSGA